MKLIFLGRFRELAGARSPEPPPDVRTLAALKEWLAKSEPQLFAVLASVPTQIVVNQTLVRDPSFAISQGDEIAFLPPMSGG